MRNLLNVGSDQSVLSVKAIGSQSKLMVIQSVSQSFNESFDHSVIHSFNKGGLIILYNLCRWGMRIILDVIFPLCCL